MSKHRTGLITCLAFAALAAMLGAWVAVGSANASALGAQAQVTGPGTSLTEGVVKPADLPQRRIQALVSTSSPLTPTVDAFAHWVYNGGTPTVITVPAGTKLPMDLFINSGSGNQVTAQQSYMTFTYSVLQIADPSQPGCVPTTTIQPDRTYFEAVLQNEQCNGPNPCTFRGLTVDPGSFAYASGALSNPAMHGDFRVAQATWCAANVGRATVRWQFSPPDPPERDSEIVEEGGTLVQNPALYTDFVVNVVAETPTPTPTATATPCPMNFSDVQSSDWYYPFVNCLYCRGAISGYADGTFRPNNNTTRGQLTKIVVLAFNFAIDTTGGPHFSDVPQGSAFYPYVETAYNRGLISGYSDGTFRPGNNVTRAQLSKIVVQAGVQAYGWVLLNPTSPSFSDVPPSDPFYQYVETAVCHQIVSGYSDGTFRPGNNATRAQISKIVCLAVENQAVCGTAP